MVAKLHPSDAMTSRQRLLAAYRGEEVDRLPYWAKVSNGTWKAGQPKRVQDMTDLELLDFIAADGIFGAGARIMPRRPHVEEETTTSETERVTVTHTPDGDLVERWGITPGSVHPVEFPIKTVEDIKRYRWLYTDVAWEVDEDSLAASRQRVKDIGERGIFKAGWGTTPLMHLVEHVIGPIETHIMLHEHPDELDDLIWMMHAVNLEHVRQVADHAPADMVVSVENTSTTLISPQQFERYCYRHLCEVGQAVRDAGKMHELHMCGHTLALLERIDTIPACSIEAYTAPTLGNTRLVDGRTRAPSKTLVGGTNVNTWLLPVEKIKEYIEAELAACPDHRRIVLTTAGVAPPGCPAEVFRQIGQWLPDVPVRMN